ncbi:C-type lectin domain family 2 member D-like [Gopherus flavomarginatus]|uniref:C-type lectin domain family 2 member D-like n=1 Tax=Gopherus flavomarginatus TaxID=286002 RepID=UPI0021CBC868|nr:C-type lectin domain family 2 member D-like [Gopherus flavomarginatus]
MGPATGAAESEVPLQELHVDGKGNLEAGVEPEPCHNCKKSQTGPVVVALIVVSSALIAVIIALAVLASKLSSADLCPPACTDGWIGYRGKCYYFSKTEGNWTYVQRLCSSFGASLAGIDSEQELMFLLCHKDIHEHWISLWREQGQPWKWTNSTEFNDLFQIRGGDDCAYLNDEKGVSSSRCYMERRWICRQT